MTPTLARDRIRALDVLRGFALLGILLMNILDMGMPQPAYFNPRVAGGDTGVNLWAWILQYVLFDGKMRGLFSMMFGAGIVLITAKSDRIDSADIYFRRTLWLMLFGLLHAFLIWRGDILYPYALCALFLFPFRRISPKAMLITCGVMIAVLTAMSIGQGFDLRDKKEKAQAAEAIEKKGGKLTDEQKKNKEEWEKAQKDYFPPPDVVKKEIDAYRGGWVAAFKRRAEDVLKWHSLPAYFPGLFDFYAMMFLGMALLKLDVLTAARPASLYWNLLVAGYLIGLPVNALAAWLTVNARFDMMQVPFLLSTYHLGRVAVMIGHMSLLLLLLKGGLLQWLTNRLAAVGQMAFSNYISHSMIGTLIFNGYGLGMFGQLQRHQLYFIVPVIWAFNLMWSPIWLRYFQFGPLEWCWRSLTYWKRQPMRPVREEPAPSSSAAPGSVDIEQETTPAS